MTCAGKRSFAFCKVEMTHLLNGCKIQTLMSPNIIVTEMSNHGISLAFISKLPKENPTTSMLHPYHCGIPGQG